MKPKKGLKKLVLKQEAIVNLNDHEMGQMEGGGTTIKIIHDIAVYVTGIVGTGVDNSWWFCEPPPQPSKVVIPAGDGESCLLDEVVVKP
jgi:hypothetical protein